jgi:ABC-type Fe3+ transport system permease subunit
MAELFSNQYQLLWAAILAILLFVPVRQLIWIIMVRKAERDGKEDQTRRQALKKRASVTAAMLCFVFAFFYTAAMMKGPQ